MNYISELFGHVSKIFNWWIIVMPWERSIRVRFGNKVKVLSEGTYLRIPFFDSIYTQTTRLRIVSLPPQTITTLDEKTLTLVGMCGYKITDIGKMYDTLYQPESTICNIVMSEIAEYISSRKLAECSPKKIELSMIERLSKTDFGIEFSDIKIVNYAIVKTYRLIQDSHWTPDSINMNDKK